MKWDYRNQLLTQIEMLRGNISHKEISEQLRDVTERCLVRYITGKSHLIESEFREVAKALSIDAQVLARAWASSHGLRASSKDAVSWIVSRAYQRWRQIRLSPIAVFHPLPLPWPSFEGNTLAGCPFKLLLYGLFPIVIAKRKGTLL